MRIKQSHPGPNRVHASRRSLLVLGVLALVYPLLKFVGYSVPKKPKRIELNSRPGASGAVANRDVILFDREQQTWAVSRRCTHLGCTLNFYEQGQYLECPCHQSRFTLRGEVVRGPAKKALHVYPVERRDTPPYYTVIT